MASRRDFIKQSAVFGMGVIVSPDYFTESKLQLGLQLFTVNKEMKSDLVGTLKKVAAMGYKEVETYDFRAADANSYWNVEAKALKKVLDANGLRSISGHYDLSSYIMPGKTDDDLKRYVDHCIQGALSDVAYMSRSREVFWASRGAVVWVDDGPSTLFS